MAEHLLSDFNINTDEPENGIRELVKIIKPHWDDKNFQIEALSGGYSSKIFKCFDPKNREEKITVRLRYLADKFQETGMEHFTNTTEPQVIQHLSKLGHFPKIFAIFANGYCYEYVIGKPMVNAKLKTGSINELQLRAVAKELFYIHKLKLDGLDYNTEGYFQRMNSLYDPKPFKKGLGIPTKETIMNEFHIIREKLKTFNMPLVLCHSDPHPGNFVWNDETNKITFLDWEMVTVGYLHVDLAYFIVTCQLFDSGKNEHEKCLPEDFENKFLNVYFQELCDAQHQKFDDNGFQKFKEIVHQCKLGPIIVFLLFFLTIQAPGSDEIIELPQSLHTMLDFYLNMKEKITGSRKFYSEL